MRDFGEQVRGKQGRKCIMCSYSVGCDKKSANKDQDKRIKVDRQEERRAEKKDRKRKMEKFIRINSFSFALIAFSEKI